MAAGVTPTLLLVRRDGRAAVFARYSCSRFEQHRVAVAEEAVALGDGMGVGGADGVVAGKG